MKRLLVSLLILTASPLTYAQDTVPAADYAVYEAWLSTQLQKPGGDIYLAHKTVPINHGRQIWYEDTTMSRQAAKNYRPDSLLIWQNTLRRPEWEALFRRYNATPPSDSAQLDKHLFTTIPVNYWPDDVKPDIRDKPATDKPRNDLKKLTEADYYKLLTAPPYYRLSRVTYSEDGKRALFYGAYYCGSLCGQGDLLLLEQVAGNWKVYAIRHIWVS